MPATKVLTYGAVPGTAAKFNSEELVPEEERPGANSAAVMWVSPFGVILGLTGGQVKNLTEQNYNFPAAQRGAGLFRVSRGYSSYIASLKGNGAAQSTY
jgi:hypothetical protein